MNPESHFSDACTGAIHYCHWNVEGSGQGTGTGTPCDYCALSDSMTLEVEWDVDGEPLTLTLGPMLVNCQTQI